MERPDATDLYSFLIPVFSPSCFRYKVNVTPKDPEALYFNNDDKGSFDPFKERKLDHPTT